MVGDRERCLAVGMDDYLSKPFTLQQLEAVIQRWLPASPSPWPVLHPSVFNKGLLLCLLLLIPYGRSSWIVKLSTPFARFNAMAGRIFSLN